MVPGQAGSGSQTCCLLQGRSGSQGCSCTHQHTHGVGLCQNRSSPTHTTLLFFASRQIITTHQASAKSRAEMHSGGMHAASGIPVLVTAQEVKSQTAGSIATYSSIVSVMLGLLTGPDGGVTSRLRARSTTLCTASKGWRAQQGFFRHTAMLMCAHWQACQFACLHIYLHTHTQQPQQRHMSFVTAGMWQDRLSARVPYVRPC